MISNVRRHCILFNVIGLTTVNQINFDLDSLKITSKFLSASMHFSFVLNNAEFRAFDLVEIQCEAIY